MQFKDLYPAITVELIPLEGERSADHLKRLQAKIKYFKDKFDDIVYFHTDELWQLKADHTRVSFLQMVTLPDTYHVTIAGASLAIETRTAALMKEFITEVRLTGFNYSQNTSFMDKIQDKWSGLPIREISGNINLEQHLKDVDADIAIVEQKADNEIFKMLVHHLKYIKAEIQLRMRNLAKLH